MMSDIARTESIHAFAEVARRYCEWFAANDICDANGVVGLQRILAELHLRAMDLPAVSAEEDSIEVDNFTAPENPLDEMRRIAERMPIDTYFAYFDPLDTKNFESKEAEIGSLADDLCDINLDLKKGFAAYNVKNFEAANWTWRFNFFHHWGEHLTGAILAIHAHLSSLDIE